MSRALGAAALWWALVLGLGLSSRAFDPSDPGQQLAAAARSAQVLRAAGPRAWLGAVAAGSLAKPAQNAVLSLAFAAGVPASPRAYLAVTALFTLAALLLAQLCVGLLFGLEASAAFAVLCACSSAVLAEAFHGGHTWYGQAFLWGALALELRKKRAELVALLCGLSVLASHHMAPLALALCVHRLARSRGRALPGVLLGAFGPLVLMELLGSGAGRPHYWDVLGRMLSLATQTKDPALDSIHGFIFRWLFGAEGAIFGALILAGAAYGCLRGRFLFAALLGALCVYELPWALRIGRVQLPLLLFFFAAAAAGAAGLPRKALAGGLLALLVLSGPKLLDLRADFQFRGPAVAVGPSLPFDYGETARVSTCAELAKVPPQTEVLVSRWSGWYWRGFLGLDRFDVPVEKLFASNAPSAQVPGVESSSYQLYSNDALFQRVRAGELAFPVANRVYRAADVQSACK